MKKFISLLTALIMVTLLPAACGNNENQTTTAKIIENGQIVVGVKTDVPYFSYFDEASGAYIGYEIELAEMIAEELLGSRERIQFVPVTTRTRSFLLENNDVDIVIASFTVSDERLEDFNFSHPYYTDYLGLLVRNNSDYRDINDLDNKFVGVLQSSTAGKAVQEKAAEAGVGIKLITYASYEDIKAALLAGRCDAFCADRAILRGYENAELHLTPDKFSPQNYAIATKKNNTELAVYISELIEIREEDGTLDALKTKYGI
jgi:putative glutamine transport system substrate-binding protein